jgi:septal ring factor EnvC (AmiA/AmiB activator)
MFFYKKFFRLYGYMVMFKHEKGFFSLYGLRG